jgi:hypothetical protein
MIRLTPDPIDHAALTEAQGCSGGRGAMPLFSALLNYRHSEPNPEAEWSRAPGVRLLGSQGGTNYPVVLSVDDLGEDFVLQMETHRDIDPQRMIDYLHTAMQSLVQALGQAPQTLALSPSVLPESERHRLQLFNNAGVSAGEADPTSRLRSRWCAALAVGRGPVADVCAAQRPGQPAGLVSGGGGVGITWGFAGARLSW